MAAVSEEGGDLEQRLRRAEAALAEAVEERNRLWDELQRNNAAVNDAAALRELIAGMESSLSWRLTRPIRALKAATAPRARLSRDLTRKAAARLKHGG